MKPDKLSRAARKKLILLDIDGTITEKWTSELLDGVAEWFGDNKVPVALVTNQGGVGLNYWMVKDGFGSPEKFPTEDEVVGRVIFIARKIDARAYAAFAFQSKKGNWSPVPGGHEGVNTYEPGGHRSSWERDWRKPNPGMLLQAMADAGVTPADTLMVGDTESDRQAAENAGCAFAWADEFFGRDK